MSKDDPDQTAVRRADATASKFPGAPSNEITEREAWLAKDAERQEKWGEQYARAKRLGLKAEMRRLVNLGYRRVPASN